QHPLFSTLQPKGWKARIHFALLAFPCMFCDQERLLCVILLSQMPLKQSSSLKTTFFIEDSTLKIMNFN
ncbi:hypothetical protein, partial [Bartonella sp. AA86SXKL]|uniref:hypothetical protein n=1 Tax=Bartonella sp. AA86SXKL TaxID=3243441 RepID=UPI0035CFAD34